MTLGDQALLLARQGFYVFPITPGAKFPPAIKKWNTAATREPSVIVGWWDMLDYNIGISTSQFGDHEALLVVDIDTKKGVDGYASLLRLELEGWDLPETRTHHTPTGGRHLIYRVETPVRQGANVLGPGLDTRSKGGYIVAPGSQLDGGAYTGTDDKVVPAPTWLIDRCGKKSVQRSGLGIGHTPVAVDPDKAAQRVGRYLMGEAPIAIEGNGGDETTYRVALRCKDLGVDQDQCVAMLLAHWNDRCCPPWDTEDLTAKVANAYRYGLNAPGALSPDADFAVPAEQPTNGQLGPFAKLNSDHAFVLAGGGAHILWETSDANGLETVQHVDIAAFKIKYAPQKMTIGKKEQSTAAHWLEWKGRRSYDGIVFMPGENQEVAREEKRFFNLWRGFSVEPAPRGDSHPALDSFLAHTRDNVCRGNESLYTWLLGYFAHLVQKPWEKPLVSLVFRGGKGVGKNACIERVGALLGRHFLLTSNRRYLVGNFNGHLENCLLFALDEAFWSGDKQAEGTLKDLITGREHVVEHKGKEPYTVANKTRVVIIGNEDWLIPASHDERRFAVFDVGDGRKQDRAFFQTMREGMEADGYPVLLRFLLDFDLSGLDFNCAPATQGLADQKLHSLNPFFQWWHQCLTEGRIIGAEFIEWPESIECDRFKSAFRRYVKERNVKLWMHEDERITKLLKECAPSVNRKRARGADGLSYSYSLPSCEVSRREWDTFIQHPSQWEDLTCTAIDVMDL